MAGLLEIRVLTFNCLFRGNTRARLAAIASELDRSDADVVCLQEVVWRRNVALLRSLAPSYPYAAYQPYALAVMGGLVTLSRRPIERQQFTVYRTRGRLTTIAFADWLIRKGWLTSWIQTAQGNLAVVNTHLLANYDEDWSPSNDYARQLRAELGQLGAALQAIDAGTSVIVAGDLNVPAASALYREFVAAAGLQDGFEAPESASRVRPPSLRHSPYVIDHLLVRASAGSVATIAAQTLFESEVMLADGRRSHLSDHRAVEATIALRPGVSQRFG